MEALTDWTPLVGMEFESLEEAWGHWQKYGNEIGFDVRKNFINKSSIDGKITSRGFVCSKEGVRGKDKRNQLYTHHRAETRCNCGVRMSVSLNRQNGKYKVYEFVSEHNHDLHLKQTTHMMKSQRGIANVQAQRIDLASASGLNPKVTHELMFREAGGRCNLGFTHRDLKNYIRTKRQRNMAFGEAGYIMSYFDEQVSKNRLFHYMVQYDVEEMMTNVFWADAGMIADYAQFGDVLTFDTTFGTNRDCRPVAVFGGFNQHRAIIIFGVALLYDETIDSFKWLFKSFLAAHGGKHPRTIFTDQDAAMASALSDRMPNTKHGLCSWHIMQNSMKHIGNIKKDGKLLLNDFNACMFDIEDEIEFENVWKNMIQMYNPPNRNWLDGMYRLKDKWARCHMKNALTLGIKSTQISESLNGGMKKYLTSVMNIEQFFQNFERFMEDKRYKELEAEFDSRHKFPTLSLKNSPLLRHAAKVYTPTIFNIFQEEYDLASAASVKNQDDSTVVHEYKVVLFEESKGHTVFYNWRDMIIECSCKKFETFGILCCHVIRVLDKLDIKKIPETYILRRWTREAKQEYANNEGVYVEENDNLGKTQWYNKLCPKLVNLAYQAIESVEACHFLQKQTEELDKQIREIIRKGKLISHDPKDSLIEGTPTLVQYPYDTSSQKVQVFKKKKGCKGGKRHKTCTEKQIKRKKQVLSKDPSIERPSQFKENFSPNIQCCSSNMCMGLASQESFYSNNQCANPNLYMGFTTHENLSPNVQWTNSNFYTRLLSEEVVDWQSNYTRTPLGAQKNCMNVMNFK